MWKLSPRILFLFLTCSMLSDCLSGAKLKCIFVSGFIGYLGNTYYCRVDDNGIYDNSRITIDGVEGTHLSGKSNDNVNAMYFYGISKLTYLPRNIEIFFKNLIGIYVGTTNLQEITQADLRLFPKLKEIYSDNNKITLIEKDLFKFNTELTRVCLTNNEISHIDANVFDHLHNLERLELNYNKCKTQFSNVATRSDVLSYIQRIKNGECELQEILQGKKKTEELIKNITTLQVANEECSTKFNEMKINLESAINEKSTLTKDLNELRDRNEKLQSKDFEAEILVEKLRSEHLSCEKSKNDSINELRDQHQAQSKKLIEMQAKYENLQESLQETKKIYEEKLKSLEQSNIKNVDQLKDKLLLSEEAKSNLNAKILNLVEQLNEMRMKHENFVQNKLTQAEKLIEKFIEKKNDEEVEKKDGNSDCLTLYFGPQQRPIILTN